MKLQIAIDRGGTFTDVWYKTSDNKMGTLKLLSEDPGNYKDAPFEAIKRIVEREIGIKQNADSKIDFKYIDWIRMGTTVATNALLERKGEPCALLITSGFRDLLSIGNQSRPNIFDLKIEIPEMLYSKVIEVEERILLINNKCKLPYKGTLSEGRNGEKIFIRTPLNETKVREDLQNLYESGIHSIAVALAHSYIFPCHEEKIGEIAKELNFNQISLSSSIMPMIKLVPRGLTTTADAYLTPCIKKYIDGFKEGFVGLNEKSPILFMQSDGGLSQMNKFMGSRAILSGPAGGVIGYIMTTYDKNTCQPIVGFDMGGTSTDVSRYGGHLEHIFESVTAGIPIQCPQLDINTVAAGGGSRLFFRESEGIFSVGPESAGAHPGPVCYRKGGYLTVTDANLVLGRIIKKYFPKIFGPNENEELDFDGAFEAMKDVTNSVNEFLIRNPYNNNYRSMNVEQVAFGFIQVANETMCRPIRSLTQGKGFDTSKHILACFGGAGGQHACAIARKLGMRKIFIHRFSGILSAFGLALADVVCERQEPFGMVYNKDNFVDICHRLRVLSNSCIDELKSQGFLDEQIIIECFLNMRYKGTDCSLMISGQDCCRLEEKYDEFILSLTNRYKSEFGFILENREILIDDIRIRGSGLSGIDLNKKENMFNSDLKNVEPEEFANVYFENGYVKCPIYLLEKLCINQIIHGPGIIIDKNSTIVIEPDCVFSVNNNNDIEIELENVSKHSDNIGYDAIKLSIFSHRFMSIAEQMGRVLQRTAISTNIKERLDFSCALFGPDGGLVANAPHIPVHLGAMQETVQYQMKQLNNVFSPGDVLLSNHPQSGGSHLPDLTVITPVFLTGINKPIFFLANRGHHADIGGSTPGSMPPHSKSIYEEGAVFKTFFLVKNGQFREKEVIDALQYPGTYPGCTGSRNISDNLSDLRAQVAANEKGRHLVTELIEEYGLSVVQSYMRYIQDNAEMAVRNMLKEIGKETLAKFGVTHLEAEDFMDTGTRINLKVSIDIDEGSALMDFSGSGKQTIGNLNTPRAVTQSCLIYCLRCMVGHDVPLNQGCLKPITVIIPEDSFLNPSENAAVVGGNVLTSQRIVDVIFKAFRTCAASQGCMNNVTFGDEDVGYYETVAGGSGAGPSWNGRSGVHTHMTNTRITDLEILESRYPVILERFSIKSDTGGRGKFRGGNGIERWLRFRKEMTLSLLTERRVFAPYGLYGGSDGEKGSNILIRSSNELRQIDLGGKTSLEMNPGDLLKLQTPGGGGYGEQNEFIDYRDSQQSSDAKPVFQIKGSVNDYYMQQFSA